MYPLYNSLCLIFNPHPLKMLSSLFFYKKISTAIAIAFVIQYNNTMLKTKESGILFHTFSHWHVQQDKSLCIFILNSILQVWVRNLSYHGISTIPDEHPRYNQMDTYESSRSKCTNIPTITKEQSLIALHLTVHSYELCLFGTDNVKHLPYS